MAATLQVSQALAFAYDIDLVNLEIVPDTDENPLAQNLITLKAACMLQTNAAAKAAERGMLIRDDVGAIDTREFARNTLDFLSSGKSYCDIYDEAEKAAIVGAYSTMGTAIVGPIRDYYNSTHRCGR